MRNAWLAFIVGLAVFEVLWGQRFYGSTTHVGHDFAFSAVALLEGRAWLESNGWSAGWFVPPWFTPAWCAGAAFHADPQSAFYSTLQALAIWFDPFLASHLNALLSASLAFWGGWLFAHRALGWTAAGSTVFAVLAMANAFLPMRSAVGQVGYQTFPLWILLALALCWPVARAGAARVFWPSVGVAVCLTLWLQGGFAGMMIPTALGAGALALLLVALGRLDLPTLLGRAALGALVAVAVNASKIYEAASLMAQFPRDRYAIPGFPSLLDALTATIMALTLPSQLTSVFAIARLQDAQFWALPHEWAMHFGWGAVVAALVAVVVTVARRRGAMRAGPAAAAAEGTASRGPRLAPSRLVALAGLAVLLALPLLLLWDVPTLREVLKSLPILGSTTWPMRWIVIYLPLLQWLLAAPVAYMIEQSPPRLRSLWLAGFVALVWAGPATEPLDYYRNASWQTYDPQPALAAFAAARRIGTPPISAISVPDADGLPGARNDSMFEGRSQGLCYNPIYGYRLEDFPQPERLRDGPALARDAKGQSLVFNPACLVHPRENGCEPGDGFRLDDPAQREAAERFLARKPFAWQRPPLGTALAWLSMISLGTLVLLVFAGLAWAVRRRHLDRRTRSAR